MSRSQYSDDVDGWELIRWRGAVKAALRGVRGQELLHGLASALDALPEKQLIAGNLVDDEGGVCALGALAESCGQLDALAVLDCEDYEQVAGFFNVAEALAREVQYINDEAGAYDETPAHRWKRVRAWVADHITALRGTEQP